MADGKRLSTSTGSREMRWSPTIAESKRLAYVEHIHASGLVLLKAKKMLPSPLQYQHISSKQQRVVGKSY